MALSFPVFIALIEYINGDHKGRTDLTPIYTHPTLLLLLENVKGVLPAQWKAIARFFQPLRASQA